MSRRGWSDWEFDRYYPPSTPKPVKDGIKTESKSGRIGSKWWSKKWLSAMEAIGGASRLLRGRSYARKGQVIDIHIEPGIVTAKVQGSRATPYKVRIQITRLSDADWKKSLDAMSERAMFIAKLLNGEMPDEIEEAFSDTSLSLLPTSSKDLKTDCSCPDWANPCKHIAAVYYLLAEEFDRDPFMIFLLRGRSKDEIIASLRDTGPEDLDSEAEAPEPKYVPLSVEGFYSKDAGAGRPLPPIHEPVVEVSILKRMGSIPLSEPVTVDRTLADLYNTVTAWALDKASGEP